MLRHPLSKKEKRSLLQELSAKFGFLGLDVEQPLEHGRDEDGEYIIVGRSIALIKIGDRWLPALRYVLERGLKPSPSIYVDRGATNALLRGADLMAPGVRRVEGGFGKDDVVFIYDEESGKPVALGVALYSSEELKSLSRGKVVKVLHFVGDKFFNKKV
ncbi:DUF1947 domain-containing protein [Thermogladius sp.]|uniref:DUF1947 domain-containing protein n=1 Tax=Thermogladius sp. TaxID=2023064 RepID=UPI003D1462C5